MTEGELIRNAEGDVIYVFNEGTWKLFAEGIGIALAIAAVTRSPVRYDPIADTLKEVSAGPGPKLSDSSPTDAKWWREHAEALDRNWQRLHEASMEAIRIALGLPDGSIAELVAEIERLKRAAAKRGAVSD